MTTFVIKVIVISIVLTASLYLLVYLLTFRNKGNAKSMDNTENDASTDDMITTVVNTVTTISNMNNINHL